MKSTKPYKAYKYEEHSLHQVTDELVVEESLLINVNFKPFTLTMRSPGDEEELVRGLLFTENILPLNTDYTFNITEKKNGVITAVNVEIDENLLKTDLLDKRNLLSVSSCGICGKLELNSFTKDKKHIHNEDKFNISNLTELFYLMSEHQHIYKETGAAHSTALFDKFGKLICSFEDIGRHNSVDKVIGHTLLNNTINKASFITYSGRVSYEIITKVFMAGIPFLAAVSAPSSLAVEMADELGITLLAFCRNGRATCYANSERIIQS